MLVLCALKKPSLFLLFSSFCGSRVSQHIFQHGVYTQCEVRRFHVRFNFCPFDRLFGVLWRIYVHPSAVATVVQTNRFVGLICFLLFIYTRRRQPAGQRILRNSWLFLHGPPNIPHGIKDSNFSFDILSNIYLIKVITMNIYLTLLKLFT